LVQFPISDLSSSIASGDIPNISAGTTKYFLRLYEAEGNQELSTEYKLTAHPLSQSWDEGRGKFDDNPKVTDGVSWDNRNNKPNNSAVSWSKAFGSSSYGGSYYSSSNNWATQSFSYESPDINMDVTRIVYNMLTGSTSNSYIPNNGFLLKFSGSQETVNASEETIFGNLKFFSTQTHTVYPPKLEVKWDDHITITGNVTGSLQELDVSGNSDNTLYMLRLRDKYKETEKAKFRVMGRKRFVQKTFSTAVQTESGSHIPEKSGSYSIVDVATGETIIPFSEYTYLSCDSTSNYFIQYLNGFNPDRVYKIIYKLTYDDNQELIFDDNFEFKVVR
jgi:hypothetical protein